ncbi:hypothetical protein JOY44_30215 (plasmid) [Phormidium sp. CLA17]|uniref:hypothetical protein n=1 Tax=Leptolyngbya sp. Cla-17 TaxID=2803751 RepID=UPI001491D48E|nr:hypothetical protein [Leptolyngbya sp. Cla-17]MBM0745693.1 hypothetical protein [Leptolyngbya sp. Cla-17]
MKNNHTLNPSMKVLEHSALRLILLDGAMVYGYGLIPSANNLIIQPLITFAVCTLVVFLFPGSSIRLALTLGSITAALPFVGLLLVRVYGGGRYPTYTFDKQAGILTCSTPAIFPYRPPKVILYKLDSIVAVESVTEANDDPPPVYWRSIELRVQDKVIKLYPGLDEAVQERMVDLLHNFIFKN